MALSARQSAALPQRQASVAESRLREVAAHWRHGQALVVGTSADMKHGLIRGHEDSSAK